MIKQEKLKNKYLILLEQLYRLIFASDNQKNVSNCVSE